jgi:putative transposase
VLAAYEAHDNRHRPHRSLHQETPMARPEVRVRGGPGDTAVERTDVLGGLIHQYRRAA